MARMDDDSLSGRQIGFMRAVGESAVRPAGLDARLAAIRLKTEDDTYHFSLSRFVFRSVKPVSGSVIFVPLF